MTGEKPRALPQVFTYTWLGSASATFGIQMVGVAYPLLALQMGHSPVSVAWVSFAWLLPNLLFHLPAGAIVDRWDHRRIMVISEALRFALITVTFIALGLDALEFHHLVLVAAIEGSLSVFYAVSETTRIPQLVHGEAALTKAVARSEGAAHLAVMVGRPMAGALFGATIIGPFIVNFLLCFVSLVAVGLARKRLPARYPRPPRRSIFAETREGVRELRRLRYLVTATLLTTVTNIVCSAVLIIFLANSDRNDSAFLVGVIMAATGVGGLIGSAATEPSRRLARRLDAGREHPRPISMLLVHLWMWVAATVVLALNQESWAFLVALLIMGLAGGRSNVTIREFSGLYVAPEKLGRVVGVTRLFGFGAVAVGPLVGGVLAESAGQRTSIHVMLAVLITMGLICTFVPRARARFFKDGNLTQAAQPDEIAHIAPVSWRRPKSTLDRAERASLTRAPLNGLRRAELSELLT
ncbi:MFS transporter [Herbidospora mongoliensis]|uniref:MFS transporter n=1 Tax=Herbidospora mongoliensis TaxID=688067 RepID=UPI000ACCE143|nr:MFS transporter [Herbidospora mongoliensis]